MTTKKMLSLFLGKRYPVPGGQEIAAVGSISKPGCCLGGPRTAGSFRMVPGVMLDCPEFLSLKPQISCSKVFVRELPKDAQPTRVFDCSSKHSQSPFFTDGGKKI